MKKAYLLNRSILWTCTLLSLGGHALTLEGLPGTLFSPSAQPLGHLRFSLSVGALGHEDESMVKANQFYFYGTGKAGDPDTAQIQDFQSGSLRMSAALGVGRFVDLGFTIPYFADLIDDTKAKDLSGAGVGDPSLFAKTSYSLAKNHILDVGLLATFTMPTKTSAGFLPKQPGYVPKDSAPLAPDDIRFFTSKSPGGSIQSLLTLDLTQLETHPPFRASLNLGASHSGSQGSAPQFLFGGGLEWIPLPSLEFFGNLQTETRFSKASKLDQIGKEYSYAAAGFAAKGEDGIFFSVSLQKSLPIRPYHAYSKNIPGGIMTYASRYQPRLAVAFNLGWAGSMVSDDTDHDGIPDPEDLCIIEAEDMDSFQDQDGCPELDNDQDSIYDVSDKCPLEPEDRDGFKDEDGCPEPDNDKDGIADLADKCPSEPEDQDNFEDYDGCPELDNDKDQVTDLVDKCQGLAEDLDGFEDTDGCPEPDNDKDKIPDLNDKCPLESENFNGFEDGDGCPDQSMNAPAELNLPILAARVQLNKVKFRGNTSEMLPESYPSLNTLAQQIKATDGTVVEIRGYMDETKSELEGMRISEARAVAVRNYLVNLGVPAQQLLARGMGARDPIANNHTAAGRAQNRRIEAHRLD